MLDDTRRNALFHRSRFRGFCQQKQAIFSNFRPRKTFRPKFVKFVVAFTMLIQIVSDDIWIRALDKAREKYIPTCPPQNYATII